MATESPIRMVEARGKWPSHKESTAYVSSSASMAVDEMLLGKGRNYHGGKTIVPNRSGSAPPSIEGSLAAIGDLVQSQGLKCHLSHIAGGDKKWRSISLDDSSNSSLYLSRGTLPTHKEESEDDRSPRQASVDWTGRIPAMLSLQESSPSIVRQRSLVELMQEEFSGIPAASYDQPHTLGRGAAGGVVSHNVNYSSLDDQSGSVSNAVGSTINVEDVMAPSDADHSVPFASRSSSHDSRGHTGLPLRKEDRSSMNVHLEDETSVGDSNINSIQSGVKALKLSVPSNMGNYRSQEERQHISSDNFVQEQTGQQQYSLQFQGPTPQIVSQGIGNAYGINQIPHVGKFSPAEVQPVLQSSGFTPPVYATPAAYMPSANPYYSGVQSPGFIYSPQYGVGGYAYNTSMFPSYLAGYPTHNTLPLPFDGAATQNYNIRTSRGPSGGSNSNPIDMQHLNKYYGKFGVVQPSFADPGTQLHQPFVDLYNVPGQVDPIALGDGVIGTQVSAFNFHKASDFGSFSPDHRPHQGTGGPTNVNQRRGRIPTPNYFGSSANTGAFMNIPSSSLGSSVIPTSVFSGNSFLGGRNEPSFSPNAGRPGRSYAGWPSHRAFESLNHPKTYSFLEELKSGKGRRFELSDIAGHVVELSVDQHGSRFIQQKLENCSVEEKASVFAEVVPYASKLMTDVFGNYVIQKFFEYGTSEQRKELANQLAGQILSLSMQMYGCRVIQKALDVIELDQKAQLVRELDGHVMRCVRDQNGNHVIQKCIESIPIEKIDFIISAFRGQVPTLAMHPYGCRVIQRILERCTDELQSQFIVDEILESVCTLAQDQYGNYVTQHVLERGKPEERCQIIKKLAGQIVQLSQHKFASNVVEKCLEYGDTATRELLIDEIVGLNEGNDNLLMMMKDQYANYVVQKILETSTENQRDLLLSRIRVHLPSLKKYTYGKHIVARFEQLFGEEIHASAS